MELSDLKEQENAVGNKARVALVCMPFADIARPPLGISLLKPGLNRAGIDCDIHYLNFRFADQISPGFYDWLMITDPRMQLGEWIFSKALNGDHWELEPTFLTWIKENIENCQESLEHLEVSLEHLLKARESAEPYLADCMSAVNWEQYAIVGFSISNQQSVASLALAKRLKEIWPQKWIIFGGSNCEGEMGLEIHRQFPFVDIVCRGESDEIFPSLVKRLLNGKRPPQLPGIIYRNHDGGSIPIGPGAVPIADLDALPYPDYDDFVAARSIIESVADTEVTLCPETSRGCWWGQKHQCTFCGCNGENMVYRSKSVQRAVDEIEYLQQRYGLNQFFFTDSILTAKLIDGLYHGLNGGVNKPSLSYEVKANLSKTQLQRMKAAGIHSVTAGIENLSTSVLKLMRKGVTGIQNIQLLKWASEVGIHVRWNYLWGFPGEDPQEYTNVGEIIPSLFHLRPPKGCGCIHLDRFSPYSIDPIGMGITNLVPAEGYRYVYDLPEESLQRLAYSFGFDYQDGRNPDEYLAEFGQVLQSWKSNFTPGSLSSFEKNGCLHVVDIRPGYEPQEYAFCDVDKEILHYCDRMHTGKRVLDHLKRSGFAISESELLNHLDYFIERRLMVREGDWYLSLIVPGENDWKDVSDSVVVQRVIGAWFAECLDC